MSISDLFGLGLPRGSLIGSQSTAASPGCRNYQYQGRNQGSSQHYQVTFSFVLYIMHKLLLSLPYMKRSISFSSGKLIIYVVLTKVNYLSLSLHLQRFHQIRCLSFPNQKCNKIEIVFRFIIKFLLRFITFFISLLFY